MREQHLHARSPGGLPAHRPPAPRSRRPDGHHRPRWRARHHIGCRPRTVRRRPGRLVTRLENRAAPPRRAQSRHPGRRRPGPPRDRARPRASASHSLRPSNSSRPLSGPVGSRKNSTGWPRPPMASSPLPARRQTQLRTLPRIGNAVAWQPNLSTGTASHPPSALSVRPRGGMTRKSATPNPAQTWRPARDRQPVPHRP